MKFDHVALISKDIDSSVNWYVKNLDAEILYADETWGLVQVAGAKIAFVTKGQHPSHICFEVDDDYINQKLSENKFKKHRDGSESCYISDVDGNHIEFLKWPMKSG